MAELGTTYDRNVGSKSGSSVIGPTVVMKGELTADEDIVVMGRVEGVIDHSGTITVHGQGTVAAEVKAAEVVVQGTVDGNLYATKRVQVSETGNLLGNVYSPRVGLVDGATFRGSIDMDSDSGTIEKRFKNSTGRKGQDTQGKRNDAKDAKGETASEAASGKQSHTGNASNQSTGDNHASKAEEQGHSELEPNPAAPNSATA